MNLSYAIWSLFEKETKLISTMQSIEALEAVNNPCHQQKKETFMKSKLELMCILSLAAWGLTSAGMGGEFITAASVLNSYGLGAPAENILAEINAPTNTVQSLTALDIENLRQGGVPSELILAMQARSNPPAARPMALGPENIDLVELVKLVQSGLSEQIISDQIRDKGLARKPSVADLLYLKNNHVPENIISQLMEAPILGSPESSEVKFEGLVLRKFFNDRPGMLVLLNNKLSWRDATKAAKGFDLFMDGLNEIVLFNQVSENDRFCYKVEFKFTKGDDYAFEDLQKDEGGNKNLVRMVDYLKQEFLNISFIEKDKH